ncbi:unnamed protein product [Didymodactylos carnosus]|uniref:Palmitoyltransferase n=2 Tax=Didymodactylos carnosus TaxID=1234261 RepID=A0A815CD26_9BILA|nr:unnamed protein product [Didymodactylos carnosus]CAF4085662.1 unnamed protein product [Didymodactylos carnosus]
MLITIVIGTLFIFLNSLLQFAGSFNTNSLLNLQPFYSADKKYAILMIPSSLIAFQIICAIVATIAFTTFALTIYLLGFHIYLCFNNMSTYDYIMRKRVDNTMLSFNKIANNSSEKSTTSQQQFTMGQICSNRKKINPINNVPQNHRDLPAGNNYGHKDMYSRRADKNESLAIEEQSINHSPRRNGPKMASLLFEAIEKGQSAVVLKLLRNRIDVNTMNERRQTPLMIAAKYGRQDIVAVLLEKNANVNFTDDGGKTALHYAVEFQYASIIKLLCRNQANMNNETFFTKLKPIDYTLVNEDLYATLEKYEKGNISNDDENEDDDVPKGEPYEKKKKAGKKKKGGKSAKKKSKKKKKK